MATPSENLAASLAVLHDLQRDGRRVFQSKAFSRVHRERLRKNGFLQEVMKGWLISSSPTATTGDSTPWYASFWEFCARYCQDRFGTAWHLSAEQSILLYSENSVVPDQVIVYSPKASNNATSLLSGTSIYDLKHPQLPSAADIELRDGLRLFAPAAAAIKVPEAFFIRHPIEMQTVLASIRDASDVLSRLLDGGHSAIAGRLAGAFRRIGRMDVADEIAATMKAAGYTVRESDPFAPQQTFAIGQRPAAPIVLRLTTMWAAMRETVIAAFPKAPGLPHDQPAYLKRVDDIYQSDAYHSLSIEGYRVTPDLIERVRAGTWNPDNHDADRQSRDALAARGYWQAFQLVKKAIAAVIGGTPAGEHVRMAHRDWYRELFQPCVAVGLIPASALAGYRHEPVYLRGSRYVPPRWETVRDAMPALFDLLEREPEPCVRAVLGHWLFGYVHPYPDGNGRVARFLMNAMLASGGYPWTIIRIEDRAAYLNALDRASIDLDIAPFADFVAQQVRSTLTT